MSTDLTITLTARNEEQSLGRCLDSVQGLADEIVVVDTGSTDGTRAVAPGPASYREKPIRRALEEHGCFLYSRRRALL